MTLVYRSVKGSALTKEQADGNIEHLDTNKVNNTGAETIAGVKTFSSDPIIPDEVYGPAWNGALEPTTKNAVYDKIEALALTIPTAYDDTPVFYKDGSRNLEGNLLIVGTGTNRIDSTATAGDDLLRIGTTNANFIYLGNTLAPLYIFGSSATFYGSAPTLDTLTGETVLELDVDKKIISATKATGYNLALGTTAGTVLEGSNDELFRDNRNNLIYDSQFESSIDQDSDTLTTAKFLWWDEGIVSTGVVKRQVAAVLSQGVKSNIVKIETGASGAGTYFGQTIWLWNYPEISLDNGVMSVSVWIKQTVANSAIINVDFIDRNNATPGVLLSGATHVSTTSATTGSWVELKIENIEIPNIGDWSGITEVAFGARVIIKNQVNSSTVEISQPMANKGIRSLPYISSDQDFSKYYGCENLAYKLYNKENVEINFLGDSLTRSSDASQTGRTLAAYPTLFANWIESKFSNTVTKRNNGAHGAADANSFAVLEKMTLTHSPDLVVFANGRNVNSTTTQGVPAENYPLRESMIRRVRSQSKYADIINFVPFFNRLESGKFTEARYAEDQKDRKLIEVNRTLNNRYRCGTLYSAYKTHDFGIRGGYWNIFGSYDITGGDSYHPNQMGHYLILDEFKHILWGSYLNNKYIPFIDVTSIDKVLDSTLVADMEDVVTIYPDQFVNGVYDGVTVTMTGTWVADSNMVSDGRLTGATGYTGYIALGEFPQPYRTNAQLDAIELSWTGRHFGIWFLHSNNRGVATVTIDGVPYDFDTSQATAGIVTNATPKYCTFLALNNPNSIALTEGAHTLKIHQKNAGASDVISIAMITLF